MNWLKTKMGSHGWDLSESDIKKPDVLFLAKVKHASQEMEDFDEYFTVKYFEGTRETFLKGCKKGKYDGLAAIMWNSYTVLGPLDAEIANALPKSVAIVSRLGAGYDSVDVDALTAKGITFTNTPGAVNDATADAAMFLTLGCMRHFSEGQESLKKGQWRGTVKLGHDMAAKTIGIVGLGGIGKAIAKRANAFGMMVQYYNRTRLPIRVESDNKVNYAAYDTLLRESDVVVIAVPYSPATKHLISKAQFEKMKPGVVFVNIARGPIVDEAALVAALESGKVSAAGLDVFEFEPKISPGLLNHPRCTLLPHMGTYTEETSCDMERLAIKNIKNFLNNGVAYTPVNKVVQVVDPNAPEKMMSDAIDISKLELSL